jgi:hypothetical protein
MRIGGNQQPAISIEYRMLLPQQPAQKDYHWPEANGFLFRFLNVLLEACKSLIYGPTSLWSQFQSYENDSALRTESFLDSAAGKRTYTSWVGRPWRAERSTRWREELTAICSNTSTVQQSNLTDVFVKSQFPHLTNSFQNNVAALQMRESQVRQWKTRAPYS